MRAGVGAVGKRLEDKMEQLSGDCPDGHYICGPLKPGLKAVCFSSSFENVPDRQFCVSKDRWSDTADLLPEPHTGERCDATVLCADFINFTAPFEGLSTLGVGRIGRENCKD